MPDPTRVEGADDSARRDEPTTADAPARWSGAAPVPQGQQKKPWWSWLRTVPEEEDDWAATPPVDPWADQDTPWSLEPLPAPGPMPPTRIDAPSTPPTRIDAPAPPPTRIDGPSAPPPSHSRVAAFPSWLHPMNNQAIKRGISRTFKELKKHVFIDVTHQNFGRSRAEPRIHKKKQLQKRAYVPRTSDFQIE